MVPILINKDVFEAGYNNLKFMFWICNYVCANRIPTYLPRGLRSYEDDYLV